jgi:hypothetical protein
MYHTTLSLTQVKYVVYIYVVLVAYKLAFTDGFLFLEEEALAAAAAAAAFAFMLAPVALALMTRTRISNCFENNLITNYYLFQTTLSSTAPAIEVLCAAI